ncbi:MAG TPA: DUF2383 domain-containing protein [Chitinophagaceae bacterium]
MIGINLYKAPPYLLEKINTICSLLRQGKKQYEQVATTIKDKDLRRTMLSLAQESNQYACELSSQIHTLGGTPEIEIINDAVMEDEIKNVNGETEIMILCEKNEKKMMSAYREILNESFLYEGLRKMIRYQLNEMLCAFMQVKQIGYLKFH